MISSLELAKDPYRLHYSQAMKDFHFVLVRHAFTAQFAQLEERLFAHSQSDLGPSGFVLILQPFHTPEYEAPAVELLDRWRKRRSRAQCPAMDARTDELIHIFRDSCSIDTRLVEACFPWEPDCEIHLLLEMTIPRSAHDASVRIIQHVVRI